MSGGQDAQQRSTGSHRMLLFRVRSQVDAAVMLQIMLGRYMFRVSASSAVLRGAICIIFIAPKEISGKYLKICATNIYFRFIYSSLFY
jgi:hypothetical protein